MTDISLTRDRIYDLIEPVLEDIGYELVEVEYLVMYGRWVLRLYIDKEGGVTIADCVTVSRELGDIIDVKDIIENEYVLEVSSPGLNRPLKKEKDFIDAIGCKIKLEVSQPLEGQKKFTGDLKKIINNTIYLETDERLLEFALDHVEKSNIVYEFND